EDLLYQVQLPATVGEGVRPFINIGNIRNSGFEFLASYRDNKSNGFGYQFDLTFAANKSEVLGVGVDGEDLQFPGPHVIQKGLELAEFFGFINDGIFQSQAEVDAHADQAGKAVGMLRFRDINEDGVIDEDDRTNIGSPHPDVVLGLNSEFRYKAFDLVLFIDSKLGHDVWDASKTQLDFLGFISNHSTRLLDAWSPTNTGSEIPILTETNASFNKQPSSYFLEDGSFVRLRSIALGYTLPTSFLSQVGLSNFRIYVQGQNLLTITGYGGYDYETLDADLGSLGVSPITQYPHTKGVTVGLSVKF
ncbi:MAG: SusC/RagA family protein, partial [Bacteroidota bacterium]